MGNAGINGFPSNLLYLCLTEGSQSYRSERHEGEEMTEWSVFFLTFSNKIRWWNFSLDNRIREKYFILRHIQKHSYRKQATGLFNRIWQLHRLLALEMLHRCFLWKRNRTEFAMYGTYIVPFNEFVAGPQALGHRNAFELERVNSRLRSRHLARPCPRALNFTRVMLLLLLLNRSETFTVVPLWKDSLLAPVSRAHHWCSCRFTVTRTEIRCALSLLTVGALKSVSWTLTALL